MDEPRSPRLQRVKSRISAASWQPRLAQRRDSPGGAGGAAQLGGAHRRGHFTGRYNRRRSEAGGDAPAHLRPAAEKAVGRVPTWPRFVREQPRTLDAKLRMISFDWMVAGTKGWASLQTPDAAGLEALTGFAYMPSTLAKLVSALAISGAGTPLLETVGRHWHGAAIEGVHQDLPRSHRPWATPAAGPVNAGGAANRGRREQTVCRAGSL